MLAELVEKGLQFFLFFFLLKGGKTLTNQNYKEHTTHTYHQALDMRIISLLAQYAIF